MVTDIVHLIDRSTDHETEPDLRFLKYFNNANKNGLNSFHSAHKAIKDYASLTGAKIPNYFQSLLEMMHENDESDNADHTEEDDKFDVAPPA